MFAAKSGVPAVASNYMVGYNQKISQFMKRIGREEFLVPSYSETRSDELKRLLDLCLDSGSCSQYQLAGETAWLVELARENFKWLGGVLEEPRF
ncbi:hypothetical protein L6258_03750 [Candidatus Parcubacteria bacterium]|nr:hypothetical protein [Candidatus Parcubacteria bacterium]